MISHFGHVTNFMVILEHGGLPGWGIAAIAVAAGGGGIILLLIVFKTSGTHLS